MTTPGKAFAGSLDAGHPASEQQFSERAFMSQATSSGSGTGRVPETRVTKQRIAVGSALDELDDFVSTQELYGLLHERGDTISLATAYRILQSMADEGAVDVLRNGEGEAVYRRCSASSHHHHLLCRNCGRAVEIETPTVEKWAEQTAATHGFTDITHTVEIFGLCPECAARR